MAGLKFRILLDTDSNSEIFRDILIDSNSDFETFYKTIITSFNFNGDQMASFYMSNDDWDKGHEITLMDMSFGDQESDTDIMNNTSIASFIEESDQKMILVHDFMRLWIFLIELIGYEKEGPAEPQILLSVGDAPSEDSKQPEDNEGLFEGEGMDLEDEDEFGFDGYSDDYSDEDLSDFSDFEY